MHTSAMQPDELATNAAVVGAHAAGPKPAPTSSRRWTLVAAITGSSLAFIDGTVVNVALPAIQSELNATVSDAQWVMESYALFLASLLLVGGAMGDRFGRRLVFMLGVGLFVVASLACALSGTVEWLIAARAVQGVGAALLVPGSLALISAAYPQAERGAAIGTWSAFSAIMAAIGPVIGGFLVDHYSWKWAFIVNLPLGAALLWICAARVSESRGSATRASLDWPGACLATAGLAGVVFALIEAPARGWADAWVVAAAAFGMAALVWFVRVQATSRAPMLPLALFRQRDFSGANLLTFLLYGALGGGLFFLPLNLIQVQGFGATAAGAALLPFILIIFGLSRFAGSLVSRVGARRLLMAGPAVAACGFALFTVPSVGGGYWLGFFPAVCILGLGMSITVAPLTTTVMNAVGPELAGTASGVNNAVSRAAGLLAIAAFGILLTRVFDMRLAAELALPALSPDAAAQVWAQRHKLAAIDIPAGLPDGQTGLLRHAIDVSFVAGFRWVMALSAAMALLSALAAWLTIGGKAPAAPMNGPIRC